MTGLTQGYAEAVMCSQAGTALSDNATAAVLNPEKGSLYIPPNWWDVNKGVHLWARGIVSSPSSGTATITLGASADTTQGTLGSLIWTNATAITPANSSSNWFWELELGIICSAVSGGTATVVGLGMISWPTSASANSVYSAGSTTGVSLNIATPYFLDVYGKWGTAVASNTLTLEHVLWIPN